MKNKFLTIALTISTLGWAQSQTLPIDFESAVTGMQGYDNATFTIASNPNTTGNSSANVGKIVKVSTADLWAGGKITAMDTLDFSSPSTSVFSMKIYTTQPVGTVIKIKLESPYTSEVDAVTTVSGAWETLIFDFGIPAPNGSVDLVIMPQPFTPGSGATFFVDDLKQIAGSVATPRSTLPITFENGTTADHFFDFESAILKVVANPDISVGNSSQNVAQLIRYVGAPFGGSKITFVNPLDFVNHPEITMKVWTLAPVGTNVTLKAEKPFWGEERTVQTTKSGQWETLTFSFANAPLDMPTLAFLFDFTAGSNSVGDGSVYSTFYFDDVKFANVPLAISELDKTLTVKTYPNPAQQDWNVSVESGSIIQVDLLDLNGKLLSSVSAGQTNKVQLNVSHLAAGSYVAKIRTEHGITYEKLIKE